MHAASLSIAVRHGSITFSNRGWWTPEAGGQSGNAESPSWPCPRPNGPPPRPRHPALSTVRQERSSYRSSRSVDGASPTRARPPEADSDAARARVDATARGAAATATRTPQSVRSMPCDPRGVIRGDSAESPHSESRAARFADRAPGMRRRSRRPCWTGQSTLRRTIIAWLAWRRPHRARPVLVGLQPGRAPARAGRLSGGGASVGVTGLLGGGEQ
jgi:hypothetical protein